MASRTSSRTSIRLTASKKTEGCDIYSKGKLTLHQPCEEYLEEASLTDKAHQHVISNSDISHTDPPQSVRHEVPAPLGEEETQRFSAYIEKKMKVSEKWATLRKKMADQMVCNAYPAKFTCAFCSSKSESIYRCQDCGPSAYYCEKCFNLQHTVLFLHLPEKWNLENYINYKIWNRPDGHICKDTTATSVIILDDKGRQHYQGLQICQCQPLPVIMLHYGLWPASPLVPRVAFTLDFMHTLRAIVLEGQISLHAFCSALQKCRPGLNRDRNNELVKDLYRVISWETVLNFMWTHHYVSHMQFADGCTDGTKCTACPQEHDTDCRRIAMDGNMKLVRRGKSGHSVRNPMHEGRFFLPQSSVDEFLNKDNEIKNPQEQNCSRFQAGSVIRAPNKTAKLDVTGTFASVCSHDFPCAIFNMRHGERMGYPIFMMQNLENVGVLLYDLGCQLERVLKKRNIEYPATLGVGIFHIYAHQMACQLQYSPRSIIEAGLFDGEGTERLWSYLGRFSLISKEMTPENRQDVLTEALLYYAQRLAMKMDETLGQKLGKAYVLRDMSQNTLEDELALLNGISVTDVFAWSMEERAMAGKPPDKKEKEPWEESYALRLHAYYTDCAEAGEEGQNNPDEETARLEALLTGLERRFKVERRWKEDSEKYKRHLNSACAKQRIAKLCQLRDAVVQYNFMVTMKNKYSKGESLGKRIVRQVLEASRKVNRALTGYNELPDLAGHNPPQNLQRSDVTPLQAPIWQYLAPEAPGPDAVPASNRRKLIDAYNINMRAREEIDLTSRDLARHMRYLLDKQKQLDATISELQNIEKRTTFQEGALSMLVVERYRTYASQNAAIRVNDKLKKSLNTDEYLQVLGDPESNPDVAEIQSMISAVEEENEFDPYHQSEI